MKRFKTKFEQSVKAEPQKQIEPFRMHTAEIGTVEVHHANFIVVGEVEQPGGTRLAVTIGTPGCKCGCGGEGIAFLYTPAVEHIDTILSQLHEAADRLRSAAASAAAAALAKAAGK